MNKLQIDRRSFVAGASAVLSASALPVVSRSERISHKNSYEFCAFIKFIQDLSFEELAQTLKGLGFDGAEVTVRKQGYIAPESAADQLPKLAAVFKKHYLKINILTTDIVNVESPHAESILKVGGELGIRRYRMGYCRYDMKAPIRPQLESLKPKFSELAALNRQSGIAGAYHNHAGGRYVGASFWDLQYLLRGIPVNEIGCVFDIRHAVAEGSSAWPVYYDIIKPHISAFSVKDFHWAKKKPENKRLSPVHCPLGNGQVDYEKFLQRFKQDFARALVSLHVEYLPKAGVAANVAAIKRDFAVLREAMGVEC